ncbi:unnamed protein product [Discula destructiva]
MGALTQLFPPRPQFTGVQLRSLAGKVFIVTGGNSGIGFELTKILYSKEARVYVAGRSSEKVAAAFEEIKAEAAKTPSSTAGLLSSLTVDLGNFSTIRPCVSEFLHAESRFDVLFNNAGLSRQPPRNVTAQGHEIHMGTNCLGLYLLTILLLPILAETAKSAPKNGVRAVFTSSGIIDITGPPGSLSFIKPDCVEFRATEGSAQRPCQVTIGFDHDG